MQKCFIVVLLFITTTSFSQTQNLYVAARSGLSMRDKPDAKATILVKIPYNAKLTVTYPEEIVNISTEGMEGAWAKTTYEGKTGYVVNSYLLPAAPPKAGTKTMKEYLSQLSAPAGTPVILKSGSIENLESGGSTLKKQLFKNGAEYHEEQFYEANNDTYFIPGFTIQQGFILLRLIAEFKNIFAENDFFPAADKTIKHGESECDLKVEKEKIGEKDWINKISAEYEDGAIYNFQMFQLGSQLVISFGGGV
jgi:uncharacterized protein YgiM (DUF1202 family)